MIGLAMTVITHGPEEPNNPLHTKQGVEWKLVPKQLNRAQGTTMGNRGYENS